MLNLDPAARTQSDFEDAIHRIAGRYKSYLGSNYFDSSEVWDSLGALCAELANHPCSHVVSLPTDSTRITADEPDGITHAGRIVSLVNLMQSSWSLDVLGAIADKISAVVRCIDIPQGEKGSEQMRETVYHLSKVFSKLTKQEQAAIDGQPLTRKQLLHGEDEMTETLLSRIFDSQQATRSFD